MSDRPGTTPEMCTRPCTRYCDLVHLAGGRPLAVNALLVCLMSASGLLTLIAGGVSTVDATYLVGGAWVLAIAAQAICRARRAWRR